MEAHRVENCSCGTPDMCECCCKECLFRNSERIARDQKYERLGNLLHVLESSGIEVELLAELMWMARGQFIEKQIAERVEKAVKKTFERLRIKVDWKE